MSATHTPPIRRLYRAYRWLRRLTGRALQTVLPIPRLWNRHGLLLRDKKALVDFAFRELGVRSFADLGGVWRVEGGYTFHALDTYDVQRAVLVDLGITSEVKTKAAAHRSLELVHGNFGEPEVAGRVGTVDAILLFDVLLHQVKPDWDEILDTFAPRTRVFLVFNPQWVRSEETVRLVDLGRDEYFRLVRVSDTLRPLCERMFDDPDSIDPSTGRRNRDNIGPWQWGVTDRDLISKLDSLGFELRRYWSAGPFGRYSGFENHAFAFGSRSQGR